LWTDEQTDIETGFTAWVKLRGVELTFYM